MEDHKPPRRPAFLLQNLWGYLWLADVLSDPSQGSERVQGQSCFHCSVTQSYLIFWDPMDCSTPSSPSPGAGSNSHPLSQWCHPASSSSVISFSSCLQSFPASASFPVSQFFSSSGRSIGASTSASVLPMNIQDWFPLGLLACLLAVQGTLKSLLQHHSSKASILWCSAFFMFQLSPPYITIGKAIALTIWTFVDKWPAW